MAVSVVELYGLEWIIARVECVQHKYGKLSLLTTYSNTKVNVSRVWTISCSVTIFECFNSFSKDASRMAVNGAPSSSCSLISFSATTWFVKLVFIWFFLCGKWEIFKDGYFFLLNWKEKLGFHGIRWTKKCYKISNTSPAKRSHNDGTRF